MDIPTALAAISSGGSAAKALAAWRRKTTGDARSLVDELSTTLRMPSLDNTDLASWQGKETEELVFAIYDKIKTLIVKFPYTSDNKKYRWGARVHNIRKRIWLLLRHVKD